MKRTEIILEADELQSKLKSIVNSKFYTPFVAWLIPEYDTPVMLDRLRVLMHGRYCNEHMLKDLKAVVSHLEKNSFIKQNKVEVENFDEICDEFRRCIGSDRYNNFIDYLYRGGKRNYFSKQDVINAFTKRDTYDQLKSDIYHGLKFLQEVKSSFKHTIQYHPKPQTGSF